MFCPHTASSAYTRYVSQNKTDIPNINVSGIISITDLFSRFADVIYVCLESKSETPLFLKTVAVNNYVTVAQSSEQQLSTF
jgi:hypothetical protein